MKIENGNKTFFIVPGFREQAKDKQYKWLVEFLEDKGVRVIKTPVVWNYKTLSENSEEFISFFNKNKSKENYVLGFSYGAVIALLTANLVKPKMVYLCSLSPDFLEDTKLITPLIRKYIGKKRYADVKTRSGIEFAKGLLVSSIVLYGEKEGEEYPQLKKRCEETSRLAKNSRLIVVKNSPHQIDFPEYVKEIKRILIF